MARKKFKIKVSKSTHWYFTIIVKKTLIYMFYHCPKKGKLELSCFFPHKRNRLIWI